jgi:hypothetical protein
MSKCESVTIRIARNGFIVDAFYPYEANAGGPGMLTSPRNNIPTVASSLSAALERVAKLFGGRVSVSEEPGLALAEEPEDLFDRGGGSPGMQFL